MLPPPLECVVVRAPGSLLPPATGNALIEHLAHSGRSESIERPESEAVGLFWRFAQAKLCVDESR